LSDPSLRTRAKQVRLGWTILSCTVLQLTFLALLIIDALLLVQFVRFVRLLQGLASVSSPLPSRLVWELRLQLAVIVGWAVFSAVMLRLLAHKKQVLRRRQAGLCVHCGYDVRGMHERCPECGGALAEESN
jgi:hypothetical protein